MYFLLRKTCHNADSERKTNKKVFLDVIRPTRNFSPTMNQKSLFPTVAPLNKKHSIPSREGKEFNRSRNPVDLTGQGWQRVERLALPSFELLYSEFLVLISPCPLCNCPGLGTLGDVYPLSGKMKDRAA